MNPTQDGFIVSVTNPSPATNISATSVTATTGSFTSLSTSSLALGSINSTPIGNTVPSTGAFTTLSSTLSSVTLGGYTLTVAQTGTLGTMAFQGVPAAGLVYSTGSGVIPATIGSGLTLAAGGTLSATGGGGGSGTVNSGTLGQMTWYAATGTAVSGNANVTYSAGALTIGVAGTQAGSVVLSGATSGTFTLSASAAAGTGYGFAHAGGSATQSNAALVATSGDTNTYIVLTSKGTGGIIAGPAPDGTATGGNARGTYAADLQISRTANTQVASGANSGLIGGFNNTAKDQSSVVIGGKNNTAGNLSGQGQVALGGEGNNITGSEATGGGYFITVSGGQSFGYGYQLSVSGSYSAGFGVNNTVSGANSFVYGSNAHTQGRLSYFAGAGGNFSVNGDAQHGITVLRVATTATSAFTLTADGGTAGAANIVNLVNNSAMRLTIDIVGRDTTNGNTGGWKLEAIMKRGANAAATALVGTVTSTVVALDAGWASQTTPTLTADTTNGGLNLSVTPITTNSCHWVARVLAVEVL